MFRCSKAIKIKKSHKFIFSLLTSFFFIHFVFSSCSITIGKKKRKTRWLKKKVNLKIYIHTFYVNYYKLCWFTFCCFRFYFRTLFWFSKSCKINLIQKRQKKRFFSNFFYVKKSFLLSFLLFFFGLIQV